MSAHRYKQVAKPVKPAPTVRELVTQHGDHWWAWAGGGHAINATFHDAKPFDVREARQMLYMERGQLPRVEDVS